MHFQEFTQFRRRRNALLRERRNQILLAFSFWPEVKPRSGQHIYELRSYTLKVSRHKCLDIRKFGTLIDRLIVAGTIHI